MKKPIAFITVLIVLAAASASNAGWSWGDASGSTVIASGFDGAD